MNADAFRQLYDYHFAMNRKIWDTYITQLSDEQLLQNVDYSRGSLCNQLAHLMECEAGWFGDLRGRPILRPEDYADRNTLRADWDGVESRIRDYLAALQDDMLLRRPYDEGEDKEFYIWQILLHVVNHGTDHRAQILRTLNDMGMPTEHQDYVFYLRGQLQETDGQHRARIG